VSEYRESYDYEEGTMTETDVLLAIERALTADERTAFDTYVRDNWPRLVGATPADVLEHTTSYDMFLDRTEPFFGAHPDELPTGTPNTAVLHLLIILGRELTPLNLAKALIRAHLMPQREPGLSWATHISHTTARWQASGAKFRYLVCPSEDSAWLLTRWDKNLDPGDIEVVCQAAREAVAVTTPDEGRRMAELFESGQDIPEIGWFHGTPEGVSTT
jgi:hypothetical protein